MPTRGWKIRPVFSPRFVRQIRFMWKQIVFPHLSSPIPATLFPHRINRSETDFHEADMECGSIIRQNGVTQRRFVTLLMPITILFSKRKLENGKVRVRTRKGRAGRMKAMNGCETMNDGCGSGQKKDRSEPFQCENQLDTIDVRRRQNLAAIDVRFWRLKSITALKK